MTNNFYYNIRHYKINVSKNEKDIVNFLHSNNIFEGGHITSPSKEIWFKSHHYIVLNLGERHNSNWCYYGYFSKQKKYQGEYLKNMTFEELKTIVNDITKN